MLDLMKDSRWDVLGSRLEGRTVNNGVKDQRHEFAGHFATWCRKRRSSRVSCQESQNHDPEGATSRRKRLKVVVAMGR